MVFARAPQPGRCKTRLIPALGAQGAAALHGWLMRRTLASALAAAVAPVELWCEPDTRHPCLRQCGDSLGIALRTQIGGDLGERMDGAFAAALATRSWALLIGSDAPTLGAEDLRQASAALTEGCDAVIVPAEDGGYVLIGLARPQPAIFRNMSWGGDTVLEATLQRLRRLACNTAVLAPRWDVDRPADLERLRAAALPGFDGLLAGV